MKSTTTHDDARLRDELRFQAGLLRLMTVPHLGSAGPQAARLEELRIAVPGRKDGK